MVADVERGRPTEIEQLNGEILRLGARIGSTTPVNRRVVELIHDMHGRTPPRFMTPAELRRILAEARSPRDPVAV
jgi:2-dehydropantoate 2-reductase